MPRDIVVGNGRIAVALDKGVSIRDFFYPQVGLEDHTSGHEFRIGLWADGVFTWLSKGWKIDMRYMPDTLVSRCLANHPELRIRLEINDAVHHFRDVFMRKVIIHNDSANQRKVRLFFTQDFHIYSDAVGDTVMYQSAQNVIIHYKRKRYFLVDGLTSHDRGMSQFATGYKETPGREGTWKDAEDGLLTGNPVAQGSVDSVVSFDLDVPPQSAETAYYWIACGQDLDAVQSLDAGVRKTGVEHMMIETENYWAAWASKKDVDLGRLPRGIARLFKTSLFVMRAHVDNSGGIIASCDSDILQFNKDTYSYVWPRDGAIVSMALDLAGFQEVSRLFFQFCERTICDDGFFFHKYSLDGSIGSTWLASVGAREHTQLPLQEDETALVLLALWRHFQKYRDIEFISSVYDKLVVRATQFLLGYIDSRTGLPKPSFDIWEEKAGVFTWTSAAVCAALGAAAEFARVFYDSSRQEMLSKAAADMVAAMKTHLYHRGQGRFINGVYPDGSPDMTFDSSVSGLFLYNALRPDDPTVESTMNALADRLWLKTPVGGLARYENDAYQRASDRTPGNPWFVSTLWLARWHIARARAPEQLSKGLDLLNWVAGHVLPSGAMAEQIHPYTGAPVSVSPLAWSHAEFVIAVCEYLEKLRDLSVQPA